MIEPGTGLTILGSAIGGAKVIEKILGPTSEYVGEQIKEWTKKRIENTSAIFKNAQKKLGDNINNTGTVPPKILKGIFEDGAWCEDELQIEYFGGVLASSRSEVSRDDRGVYYLNLISKLTTYQLRTHYIIYNLVKEIYNGKTINVNDANEWVELEIFIPYHVYLESMVFEEVELNEWNNLLSHSLFGLLKDELISDFKWGPVKYLNDLGYNIDNSGIIIRPSKLGMDLLLWACGYGKQPAKSFLDNTLTFQNNINLKIERGLTRSIRKK